VDVEGWTSAAPAAVEVVQHGVEAAVRGRLGVEAAADVRVALQQQLAAGSGDLRVRLADAEVRDATGLGVLVSLHRRALRGGRRLVLVDVPPTLDRLLRTSRLSRVLVVEAGAALTG